MRLGGHAITEALRSGIWKASDRGNPIDLSRIERQIGPNSVDVTLGDHVLYDVSQGVLDPHNTTACIWEQAGLPYVIQPGECLLGFINESFNCDNPIDIPGLGPTYFVSQIDGRSTVGRMFLMVHVTAGFGDYGFAGGYTLELVNLNKRPIRLHPGMRIAQVSFQATYQPIIYKGAYSHDHVGKPVQPTLGVERFTV